MKSMFFPKRRGNAEQSEPTPSSTKSSFGARFKSSLQRFNPMKKRKGSFDNSVDMGAAPASPKLSRSQSRVSIGSTESYSDGGYSEGYESEEAASEDPVRDMQEGEQPESEEELPFEALSDAGSVDLMDLVHEVHPQILTMPQEQIKMERATKSRLHPMRKFNMLLMRGPERVRAATHGPRPAPGLVVVGGHNSEVGNRTINGIYEKLPGAWNGRPWYRKTVQRMPDAAADASIGPASKKLPRVPGYTTRIGINAGDFEEPAIAQLGPVKDQMDKYLYFDDRHGQWKVGSAPKEPKCFARCSAPDAVVPDRLRNWQVWDVKQGEWYFHPSMYCERGGRPREGQ